jgi:hypothetical protein
MVIQVIIRLTLYTDQVINYITSIRNFRNVIKFPHTHRLSHGIRAPKIMALITRYDVKIRNCHFSFQIKFFSQLYLCEASYILLEYAKTAMFLWMFVEGLYLHNVVTVTVFQGRFPHIWYCCIGWGSPLILTVHSTIIL